METNKLPPWARLKHEPLEMVAGRDFQPGDTLYFNSTAYPRVLWKKLSDTSWSVLEQRDIGHKCGQISIEPDVYYVIKRATPRKADPPSLYRAKPPVGTERAGEAVGGEVLPPGTRPDDFFLDRPLTQIRADGEFLAVGDVLWLNHMQGRAEILEIGKMELSASGHIRKARLDYLTEKRVAPYTFCGFHLQMFKLIAGPKFDAARRDPSRVMWIAARSYWLWKGSQ